MLCIQPVRLGTAGPFACGKCKGCLINRRRDWTARLLLHSAAREGAAFFVTLTYDDAHLPLDRQGRPILRMEDRKNFFQRLRRRVALLEYYFVGEYGGVTGRPHYHALLWFSSLAVSVEDIHHAWGLGLVDVGEITAESIAYVVGYTLKGQAGASQVERPGEFSVFSRGLARDVVADLRRAAWRNPVDGTLTVGREFRVAGKVWPVPTYLLRKLREEGYTVAELVDSRMEREFVENLRASMSGAAASSRRSQFADAVVEDQKLRRSRSAALIDRRLVGVRNEKI